MASEIIGAPAPAVEAVMCPPTLLKHNSDAQQRLLAHLRILHLLHHRNKNQHQRDFWYRHFNTLRRETKALCLDLSIDLGLGFPQSSPIQESTKSSSTKPILKSASVRKANNHAVTSRLNHWIKSGLVEHCYTAFTSLTTTPPFSALAVTLIAVLARICALTGITAAYQTMARAEEERCEASHEEEIGRVLERFAKEDAPGLLDAFGDGTVTGTLGGADDEGVKVERHIDSGVVISREAAVQAVSASIPSKQKRADAHGVGEERPKKRKKKGNAIDDLFAGL